MKNLVIAVALVALLAAPAVARELIPWTGDPIPAAPGADRTADILLEYDGDAFVSYGTSPNWTDLTMVSYEIPAGGPYAACEVWYYIVGSTTKDVLFYDVPAGLFAPPGTLQFTGPAFAPAFGPGFPPADFTIVDITGMGLTFNSGDLTSVGVEFLNTDNGIGLADYLADGVPGHSWAVWSGFWTDDTYAYGYDDGIRLGLCTGPTPTIETTWGQVKSLFE